jgi:predicted SnoaL-like aldol condensation-catalyzing enzyme
MGRYTHLERFKEGWRRGEAAAIIGALADGYIYHNPREGQISKDGFADYFDRFTELVRQMGHRPDGDLMNIDHAMMTDDGEVLTFWSWWEVPGTPFCGGSLIKVDDEGVFEHTTTIYAPLTIGS